MGQLLAWRDQGRANAAIHQFLKVRGARVEDMGGNPKNVALDLVWTGPQWRSGYVAFAEAAVGKRGLLVHPAFGRMRAFCLGTSGARVVPGEQLDTYLATFDFVESNLDDTIRLSDDVGTKVQRIKTSTSDLTTGTASLSSATKTQSQRLVSAATNFSTVAQAAAAGDVTSAFASGLGSVRGELEVLVPIIMVAATLKTPTDVWATLRLAQRVYAAAQDLDAAVRQRRPVAVTYLTRSTTSIFSVAAELYGRNARSRLDELLARNPGIRNPAAIPGGTVLQVTDV